MPCKYLTVRVDTTHCYEQSEADVVSFIFLKSRGLKLSFTRIFGSTTCSK